MQVRNCSKQCHRLRWRACRLQQAQLRRAAALPPSDSKCPNPLPNNHLAAAKLDRVFAKPFLAAFTHDDGITCLARNPRRLNSLLSGALGNENLQWEMRRCNVLTD